MRKHTDLPPLSEKERRERFDALSELGCAICGMPPQIHHLIGTKWRGMGQKSDDRNTIPLCLHHHTGAEGVHTIGKKTWEAKYGTQEELLEQTEAKLCTLLENYELGR